MHKVLPADRRCFALRPLVAALCRIIRRPGPWVILAGAAPGLALAGPAGESVDPGAAVVTRPDANTTRIDQYADRAVINWQSFSIAGQEYVQFNQPAASSVVLNRVTGGDASSILGHMSANGRVFLVNPAGIYFGPGAQIDVGGLVASIHDIGDQDFLDGHYVFNRDPSSPPGAGVVNDGAIRAADGGFVVLAGDYVRNNGIVQATAGTVALAAGDRITLDMDGDGLVSFAVDGKVLSNLAGVDNAGEVTADGGRVIMTAKVSEDLMATAVNNSGLVRAHSMVERGGDIYLLGEGGDVVNEGTVDASGSGGADGGGVVAYTDKNIALTSSSRIQARGDGAGNGGAVRVVADGMLDFRAGAAIDVSQGSAGARGGAVEVSGHGGLRLRGRISLGTGGRLLIDPAHLTIKAGAGTPSYSTGSNRTYVPEGFIESQINASNDLILVADSVIDVSGSVAIAGSLGYGNLSLAIGQVNVPPTGMPALPIHVAGAGCAGYGVCSPGTYEINPNSLTPGDVNLNGLSVHMNGNFAAYGANSGQGVVTTGPGPIVAGNIYLEGGASGGAVNVNGSIEARGSQANPSPLVRVLGDTVNVNANVRAIAATASSGAPIGGSPTVHISAGTGGINFTGGNIIATGDTQDSFHDGGGYPSYGGQVLGPAGSVVRPQLGGSSSASVVLEASGNISLSASFGYASTNPVGATGVVGAFSRNASVEIRSYGGDVNVGQASGPVVMAQSWGSDGGSAVVKVQADAGAVNVHRPSSPFFEPGYGASPDPGLAFEAIRAEGATGHVGIRAQTGITVDGNVSGSGRSSGEVSLVSKTGPVVVTGSVDAWADSGSARALVVGGSTDGYGAVVTDQNGRVMGLSGSVQINGYVGADAGGTSGSAEVIVAGNGVTVGTPGTPGYITAGLDRPSNTSSAAVYVDAGTGDFTLNGGGIAVFGSTDTAVPASIDQATGALDVPGLGDGSGSARVVVTANGNINLNAPLGVYTYTAPAPYSAFSPSIQQIPTGVILASARTARVELNAGNGINVGTATGGPAVIAVADSHGAGSAYANIVLKAAGAVTVNPASLPLLNTSTGLAVDVTIGAVANADQSGSASVSIEAGAVAVGQGASIWASADSNSSAPQPNSGAASVDVVAFDHGVALGAYDIHAYGDVQARAPYGSASLKLQTGDGAGAIGNLVEVGGEALAVAGSGSASVQLLAGHGYGSGDDVSVLGEARALAGGSGSYPATITVAGRDVFIGKTGAYSGRLVAGFTNSSNTASALVDIMATQDFHLFQGGVVARGAARLAPPSLATDGSVIGPEIAGMGTGSVSISAGRDVLLDAPFGFDNRGTPGTSDDRTLGVVSAQGNTAELGFTAGRYITINGSMVSVRAEGQYANGSAQLTAQGAILVQQPAAKSKHPGVSGNGAYHGVNVRADSGGSPGPVNASLTIDGGSVVIAGGTGGNRVGARAIGGSSATAQVVLQADDRGSTQTGNILVGGTAEAIVSGPGPSDSAKVLVRTGSQANGGGSIGVSGKLLATASTGSAVVGVIGGDGGNGGGPISLSGQLAALVSSSGNATVDVKSGVGGSGGAITVTTAGTLTARVGAGGLGSGTAGVKVAAGSSGGTGGPISMQGTATAGVSGPGFAGLSILSGNGAGNQGGNVSVSGTATAEVSNGSAAVTVSAGGSGGYGGAVTIAGALKATASSGSASVRVVSGTSGGTGGPITLGLSGGGGSLFASAGTGSAFVSVAADTSTVTQYAGHHIKVVGSDISVSGALGVSLAGAVSASGDSPTIDILSTSGSATVGSVTATALSGGATISVQASGAVSIQGQLLASGSGSSDSINIATGLDSGAVVASQPLQADTVNIGGYGGPVSGLGVDVQTQAGTIYLGTDGTTFGGLKVDNRGYGGPAQIAIGSGTGTFTGDGLLLFGGDATLLSNVTGGGNFTLGAAGIINVTGRTISTTAGTTQLVGDGSLLAANAHITANNVGLSGANQVDLSNANVQTTLFTDVQGLAGASLPGDVVLAGAAISTGTLRIRAQGNILNTPSGITADGIYLSAGQSIQVGGTLVVGPAAAPGGPDTPELIALLAAASVPVTSGVAATPVPNAVFIAPDLQLGTLDLSRGAGYLWLQGDTVSVGDIVNEPAEVVVQLTTFDPGREIRVENVAPSGAGDPPLGADQTLFTNSGLFSKLSGTTIGIGDPLHSGDVVVGQNAGGTATVFSSTSTKNMVFITQVAVADGQRASGLVDGLGNVNTTGLVAQLEFFIGGTLGETAPPVTSDEITSTIDTATDQFGVSQDNLFVNDQGSTTTGTGASGGGTAGTETEASGTATNGGEEEQKKEKKEKEKEKEKEAAGADQGKNPKSLKDEPMFGVKSGGVQGGNACGGGA